MKTTGIGLADIVEATAVLSPNAAARNAIARMCGMKIVLPRADAVPESSTAGDDFDIDTTPAPASIATEAQARSLPSRVKRLDPVRQRTRPSAPPDPLVSSGRTTRAAPAFEGLFTVRDGVELARMAASIPIAAGGIDIEKVAQQLAFAKPLTELPWLRIPSLALGAQVLVDVGRSMQPFYEDQQDLVMRLERSLRNTVTVRYFADDPMLGSGPQRRRVTWSAHVLSAPKTPVIALTDLGCGYPRRPESIRAWIDFAQRMARRQSRVVAFAAVRLERIPRELKRFVELVLWDRSAERRNVMQLAGAPRHE